MRIFAKHAKELALAHAELESLILQRTEELQNLSQRLLQVQDEERRKVARDLHDTTGQTLAALKMSISFLQESCKEEPSRLAIASDIAALADQALGEIRTMSYLLHPPLLDEVGFACAAEWYVEGFAKRSGISVSAHMDDSHNRLPRRMEIVLFRVLQESLTNVHRHSGASVVRIHFQQQSETVTLEIKDFGRGIPAERLSQLRQAGPGAGVGLAGMRERLRELTGKLEIESDGQGTCVRAVVPLYAAARPSLGDYGQMAASEKVC
jgi:two-component system NarL family sensor kinase